MINSTEYEVRQQIAKDIQILKSSCVEREISKSFIAGLDTASDIVTGEISIHPSAYDDPSDIVLFDLDD